MIGALILILIGIIFSIIGWSIWGSNIDVDFDYLGLLIWVLGFIIGIFGIISLFNHKFLEFIYHFFFH